MDIPMQIIKRYEPYRISSHLFNISSHDTINKRIKEVAKLCGIENANFVPPEMPHICCLSLELWNADRECKQDSRTHEHYYNADLR